MQYTCDISQTDPSVYIAVCTLCVCTADRLWHIYCPMLCTKLTKQVIKCHSKLHAADVYRTKFTRPVLFLQSFYSVIWQTVRCRWLSWLIMLTTVLYALSHCHMSCPLHPLPWSWIRHFTPSSSSQSSFSESFSSIAALLFCLKTLINKQTIHKNTSLLMYFCLQSSMMSLSCHLLMCWHMK